MKKNLTLLFVLALGVLPGRGATLVPVASPGWRVLKGTAEASVPIENWRKTGFVDSSFSSAPAPFWYGDVLPGGTQLSDMANGYSSFYLRHRFVVTNLTEIAALKLGAQVDDGFIAWINGAEVARVNGPSSPQHDGLATAAAVEPVVFSTYRLPTQNYLVLGTNVLCVQVFNVALGDSDIGFDCSLTSQLTETNPPVVLSQSPAPGTTVGKLDHLNITFSEPVDGVEASDLLIDTFPATAVNGAGAAYTFTFPQPEYGPVTITWAPFHGIADLSVPPNPFNAEGPGATWAYSLKDLEAPTLDKVLPESGTTVLSLLEIEVFFSEEMKGVDASDLLINGVAAKSIRFGGLSDVVFGFELTTTGVVNVAFAPGHGITDLAGNPFPGGSWTYTVDPNFIPPSVVINELMALNTKIIRDEDGDYSDWIELFNNGIHGVDLSQWTLTDDPANLRKWHFPVMTMLPGDYLLVWASGKNRTNAVNKLHTNFKLPTGGSFLALVDGRTNIASGFVPTYPPQSADISYGRDTTDQNLLGFFSTPTPRTVNKASGASVVPPVEFSRDSGTFVVTQAFNLTLSSPIPNAIIFVAYGTNVPGTNTVKNTNSFVYTNSIRITNTLAVRARAFAPGLLPSPIVTKSYIALANDPKVLGFSSDLPVIILHNYGQGSVPSSKQDQYAFMQVFESPLARSSLTNAPVFAERVNFHVRGSSTAVESSSGKSAFFMQVDDEVGGGKSISLLGLPSESDWVLYAPNNFEPARFHNPLAYQLSRDMGRYASRTRFFELYLKDDGGKQPGAIANLDYFGVFVLEEKIKVDKNRVNIDRLDREDTNAPAITGGYMWSIDRTADGEATLDTLAGGLNWVSPNGFEITNAVRKPQIAYARKYINDFTSALASTNWTNSVLGYQAYIDVDSWVDHHIHNTITFNVDALRLSGYLHKPRNGKIVYGPVWDFDRTQGSTDGRDIDPRVWRAQTGDGGTDFFNFSPWWDRLMSAPDFWQRWIDRYQEHRTAALSTNNVFTRIDGFASDLREAVDRDIAKWGFLPRLANGSDGGGANKATFATEVQWKKNWYAARLNFADTNFLARPVLSSPGGLVPAGSVITVSPAAKTGSILLYTLDGSDPRLSGGAFSPLAFSNDAPVSITITNNTRIFARSWNPKHKNLTGGGNPPKSSPWSGSMAATYYTTVPSLRIVEIHYHPRNPAAGITNSADDYEFIKLKNTGTLPLNVNGFSIGGGVNLTINTNLILAPGGTCVVVANLQAFVDRYGNSPIVAGVYVGTLNNSGDHLVLRGPLQEPIVDFNFSDGWYPITDGPGFSLVLANENAEAASYGLRDSWRPGSVYDGSPAIADPGAKAFPNVVVSEALTHEVVGGVDLVELHNLGGTPADVSGWWLSDNFGSPQKYRLPLGTTIPAGGFIVLSEANFGVGATSFGLSSRGDSIYLFSADLSGQLSGYVHGFAFGAQVIGVTFGRHVDSTGQEHFVAQSSSSLGTANHGPKVGPIVISEINYHPVDLQGLHGLVDDAIDEFIELRNISGSAQPLYDVNYSTNTWHIRGGISFDFPTNVSLPADGFCLVVSFNPTNTPVLESFRARNQVGPGVLIYGPFSGGLNNSGDDVEVAQPDIPSLPPALDAGFVPYVLEDKVQFNNQAPWPVGADGIGLSLQRLVSSAFGNDPSNWVGAARSPGINYPGGVAPTISSQPQDQTKIAFSDVPFSVTAEGPGPLYYQWRYKTTPLPGETNTTLLLKNVQPRQAGDYSVVVYNGAGSLGSRNATLSLLIPPLFAQVLQNINTPAGSNVVFSVSVTSTKPPISYQWYYNGAIVPNATGPTLSLTKVGFESEGAYFCRVTDGIATVDSATANLTILVRPFIIRQPLSQTIVSGGTAVFSVEITNTANQPIGYIWRQSGKRLPLQVLNSRSSYLTLTNITNAATIVVVATNLASAGGIQSDTVTLDIVADTDADGIPDDYEALYPTIFNPNDPSDATKDSDGDGMSNLAEYIAGTDPTDPNSYLKVERIQNGPTTLQFIAQTNRTYSVQFTDALQTGLWRRLADVGARTNAELQTITDPNPTPIRFYRLATPYR